jgi:hypothetical protein
VAGPVHLFFVPLLLVSFAPRNSIKLPDGTTLKFLKTELNRPIVFPVRNRSEELITRLVPQRLQKFLVVRSPSSVSSIQWGLSNSLMCVFLHRGASYVMGSASVEVIAMTQYFGQIVDDQGNKRGECRIHGHPQQTNLAYLICSIPIAPEYGTRIKLRIFQEDERTNRVRVGEFPITNPLSNRKSQ